MQVTHLSLCAPGQLAGALHHRLVRRPVRLLVAVVGREAVPRALVRQVVQADHALLSIALPLVEGEGRLAAQLLQQLLGAP
jgi:hypothetical protein